MLLRKILAFFALSLLLPFYAYGTVCTLNNTLDGCISYDGCEYIAQQLGGTGPKCEECQPHNYNSTSQNSTQCDACRTSLFPDTILNGKEYDPDDESTGNTECPWKCTTGWFVDNNHTSCITCPNNNTAPTSYTNNDDAHISDCTCNDGNTYLIQTTENSTNSYYCGQCEVGVQPNTNNGISTCTCPPTAIRVHGQTVGSYRLECACPNHANWDNNRCKCDAGKYLSPGTDGIYSCESCPEHSTSAVGSTNVNDCQCDDDFPNRILDENNKLIGCSACADNATFYNGSCQCKSGYYGDGTSSCTQCPIGTTTTIGATQRSDCKMTSATKFCYGSDDNKKCMHLIPASTVISVSNNT